MEIARAIDYAHSRGVVHRDLKPENILFDEQAGGIAKVTDFGLATFFDDSKLASRFNVTETHVSMGTLSYMAPEQRVDAKNADHRADIYSLGVMLYELLVGEVPIGTFDPPSQRRPGTDKRLDAIVLRCLKPARRPTATSGSPISMLDLEPFAPVSFSQVPRKISRVEQLKNQVRAAFSARRSAWPRSPCIVAAFAILGISWARSRYHPPARPSPGTALTAPELRLETATTSPGRIADTSNVRRMVLGEGPDAIPLIAWGRIPGLEGTNGALPRERRRRQRRSAEPGPRRPRRHLGPAHRRRDRDRATILLLGGYPRAVPRRHPRAAGPRWCSSAAPAGTWRSSSRAPASRSRSSGRSASGGGRCSAPRAPPEASPHVKLQVDRAGQLQAFVGTDHRPAPGGRAALPGHRLAQQLRRTAHSRTRLHRWGVHLSSGGLRDWPRAADLPEPMVLTEPVHRRSRSRLPREPRSARPRATRSRSPCGPRRPPPATPRSDRGGVSPDSPKAIRCAVSSPPWSSRSAPAPMSRPSPTAVLDEAAGRAKDATRPHRAPWPLAGVPRVAGREPARARPDARPGRAPPRRG